MAKLSQASMASNISKYSFQNLYVHYNVSEPVYMGSQMAKDILMHRVDTDKCIKEDITFLTGSFTNSDSTSLVTSKAI